ncbi:MAG: helix-turn-helix domain-containing protein [Candidatus Woesearchaeota archaeon]|jgi:putative transcriptional regulator|nr:helix-turn-helix domain-containing protein [Candidatus Woesearchaeota archaeon]MDP7622831.1 helix-turn-helix domain-containing protein [Candidatus Woesearchaeota archaeon]HJN56910.1 helix-turn-helix domain-containing protein [Candidatus Woesearchaeota archaeon]|tara:strand:+ start:49503 stop:50366 length:864 start_codon:yes stop_codon:yes gene_type:complete
MKNILIEKIGTFLLKESFTAKRLTRSCFDLLARKQEKILLIKVLEDVNSISKQYVDEMNMVSAYIGAVPLIIADKAGQNLEDNVLYTRFNLYTLNFPTFVNSIKNKFPFIKRTQAGLTASIVGNKLRKKREELGYSLNSLSKKVGVTNRMIVKYENENSEITINKAMKIHEIFGNEVFYEMNIFSRNNKIESKYHSDFSKKYIDLGFEAADTNKSPFDIIARKDNELILTEVGDKTRPDFSSLSKLLDADNLVIFKNKKPKNIPAVTKEEFLEFEKANQLIKFLKEF